MTYVCKLVDIVDTKQFYDNNVEKYIDEEFYVENKLTKFNKKRKLVKSFGNQITLKSVIKNYNIKIFTNGNVQITGIKHHNDMLSIEKKFLQIFNSNVKDIRMVMMNVTFKISDSKIHLYKLFDALINLDRTVLYTPEIYPGLKFKYNKSTALIFATGSIILSTSCEDDIAIMQTIITEVL